MRGRFKGVSLGYSGKVERSNSQHIGIIEDKTTSDNLEYVNFTTFSKYLKKICYFGECLTRLESCLIWPFFPEAFDLPAGAPRIRPAVKVESRRQGREKEGKPI
jgi:hypothetical protein